MKILVKCRHQVIHKCFAEYRTLAVMLSAVMLSVIILGVVMLYIILPSVKGAVCSPSARFALLQEGNIEKENKPNF